MKPYRTAASTSGLRLPPSSVIVSALAEALRLKSAGHPRYKSAQRYFRGERIKPEVKEEVLLALVDAAVPRGVELPEDQIGAPLELHTLALAWLRQYSSRWDRFAAEVNGVLFPVSSPGDLPVPALRLLALDLGLRYGAWLALRELVDGEAPRAIPKGFPQRWFAEHLERRLSEMKLSRQAFAKKVGVSTQTLAAWRRGGRKGLPEDAKIAKLARALAPDRQSQATTELRLRAMVAVQDLYARLAHQCGERRVEDMVEAMLETASQVHERSLGPVRSEQPLSLDITDMAKWWELKRQLLGEMPRLLWTLIMHGAACEPGAGLCHALASVAALRQEVAADFMALPGDWTDRCRYWMRFLGSVPDELASLEQHAKTTGEFPPGFAEEVGPLIIEHQLRMAGFAQALEPGMSVIRIEHPPEGKAVNRVVQAQRARSVGDPWTAIEHMRHAVRHDPQNAHHHFMLGALLGELGGVETDHARMEEALAELHIAVQLDPEFANARNEIGIVLSNMRRHEDAEEAFAQAEPYHGGHAHHWSARGCNYLGLKRYEDARAAFEKAIALSKDGQHVPAKTHLAATLMALGQTSAAKRLAKTIEHASDQDPISDWRAIVDVWGDFRFGPRSE